MFNRKMVFNLVVLLLISFTITLIAPVSASASEEVINIDIAREIANGYLQKFAGKDNYWSNSQAGNSSMLYLIDGQSGVYLFDVLNNDKIVGNIIILATKDRTPFISLSTQDFSKLLVQVEDKVHKTLVDNQKIANPRYIYGGQFLIAVEYTIVENDKEVKKVLFDI
ncbi:MAG: hypothetical protein JG781_219 [Peptococcaceae bacterium]|nr:hypothetical protein [Peptococcaceae bacterium]